MPLLLKQVFQHLGTMLQEEENIRTTEATVVLGLRLIATALLAAALTMHVRSLKVFKWEQSVSGGVLVTYLVANIGLALCAGQNKCEGKALQVLLHNSSKYCHCNRWPAWII